MSLWTIAPRDPFTVRDGRPNNGRSESATLPFPYPGTIAGMVRTRLGSDEQGVFDPRQDVESLKRARVRGPLLASAGGDLYAAPPRDAVIAGDVIRRLTPSPLGGALTDARFQGELLRLGAGERSVGKSKGARLMFWPMSALLRWLGEPSSLEGKSVQELGGALPALPIEQRTHVKITATWTAEEGMLFQASGLRFTTERHEALALAVDVDTNEAGDRELRAGVGPGGGERRLVVWEPASLALPKLPERVRQVICADQPIVRVRVILLTPAIFNEGWKPGVLPGQLLSERLGVKPLLVAACVPRPETISGWDLHRGKPKRTRRMVSAGSVYWIDLLGSPEARARWADEVMMANVGDEEQDRRDGFGLAAVGVAS